MNRIKFVIIPALFSGLLMQISCRKAVQVPAPITGLNNVTVFASDATAISAVTETYTSISGGNLSGGSVVTLNIYPSLSADELNMVNNGPANFVLYYQNNLNSTATGAGYEYWNAAYQQIYAINSAIAGLNASSALTPAIKQQLLGESEFSRAFLYFYLVNLYGDVPLVTSTNYKSNAGLSRTPAKQVWQQIIDDLLDAQNKLSPNYLDGTLLQVTTEKVRPTKWAATALLARAYLYTGDYSDALQQANDVISNGGYGLSPLSGTNCVFNKNSSEAIWQLQPVASGVNTPDARSYVLPSGGPTPNGFPVYMSSWLVNSFESNDQRLVNWVGSVTAGGITYYFPYKYKVNVVPSPVTEYEMVLRLAEQYLIRAEAENGLSQTNAAVTDLNVIRTRAGLPNYSGATDMASVEAAILHERRVEFFTEWANRWLDLKRTNTADSVMSIITPLKNGTWSSNALLYPLPLSDLQADPNLTQNTGY